MQPDFPSLYRSKILYLFLQFRRPLLQVFRPLFQRLISQHYFTIFLGKKASGKKCYLTFTFTVIFSFLSFHLTTEDFQPPPKHFRQISVSTKPFIPDFFQLIQADLPYRIKRRFTLRQLHARNRLASDSVHGVIC